MLGEFLRERHPAIRYAVPALHHRPAQAMAQVLAACEGADARHLTLVGSSLGGFYATVAAERLGCRAVLVNPAVHPQRHFHRYLGPQRNLYTGEAFELTQAHVDELGAMDVARITRPERYWLLVESADEVLDHREAVAYYADARQTVVPGGDHSLASFPRHMAAIAAWADSP